MAEDYLLVLRAVAFGACISITSATTRQCGLISDIAPRDTPFQPPAWVFGVVWPCLFATTGIAWALAGSAADAPLAVVTLLCCSWLVAYVCLKRRLLAAATLASTVIASVFAAAYLPGAAGWLMAPLAVWTAFATYLNVYAALST